MSVVVSQEPASSTVVPGGSAVEHTVHVRNSGDTVEEYRFQVVGSLARWATVLPAELRLYPGDEGTTTVTFTVPKEQEALAGPTAFGVMVVPRVHPEISDVIEGSITVSAFAEMRAELSPMTVRGRLSARLQLSIENRGNAPLPVTLRGRDVEEMLRFEQPEGQVVVEPGASARPVLRVRPRRARLTGKPERFPLTVDVTPSREAEQAGARATQLRATFVRLRLAPVWVLLTLLGLILAALLASGVLYYLDHVGFGRLSLPSLSGIQSPGAPPPSPPPPSAAGSGRTRQQGSDSSGGGADQPVQIAHHGEALAAKTGFAGLGAATPETERAAPGEKEQAWTLLTTQGGATVITPSGDADHALDEPAGNGGRQVALSRFTGGTVSRSQTWTLRPAGSNDQSTIVNTATGDCLTDAGDGRAVVGSRCQPGAAGTQVWTFGGR